MARRPVAAAILLAVLTGCAPKPAPAPAMLAAGDPARGEAVFHAGGCGTCHASPGSAANGPPRLGGGREMVSRYGIFRAPNISPDPTHGIGGWSGQQFADALLRGLSPEGAHYYPAFPYPSYARMRGGDVADLKAYLDTLPPVARANRPHTLRFAYANRRLLGMWKRRYLRPGPVARLPAGDARLARGQYLVEGPGHCGTCHTPRTALGGPDFRRWLAGAGPDAPEPAPDITPANPTIAKSSIDALADTLLPVETHAASGDWGEGMEAVRRNLAHLPAADRRAIAAYLKALSPRQ